MPNPVRRVKHYAILSLLGKGGMGEVYLAHDAKLDRNVAVKFLPDAVSAKPGARARFLREAKAAAALDHPFICKIYEEGEAEGKAFIVMEYVEGVNLRDKIARARPALREALQMTLEVAEALEVAHQKGIIHRDIKPANLICTPQGHIKVMDFGLAKHVISEETPPSTAVSLTRSLTETLDPSTITGEGVVVGTMAYMSPEQAKGKAADARSDIFSLGVVLAEMVTGRHPFSRPTPAETLSALLRDNPPVFHGRPKAVNPGLNRLFHRALAKNPDSRYKDAGEMAADLRTLLQDFAPRRWMGFRTWKSLAAVTAGAAAVLATVLYLILKPPPAPAPEPRPVTVLVTDFANRTGDSVFDGVVEQMLVLGLEQAPYLDVRKPADVRAKAAKLDPGSNGRVDIGLARLICRSDGIPVAIEGAIEPAADGYSFTSRAVNPVSGEVLAGESVRRIRKKTDVPQAVMRAGVRLSSKIGGMTESAADEAASETFTTSSLEAMKAYAEAQELTKAGKQKEAIAAYERAIREDPQFGRAYAGLAVVLFNSGEREKGQELHEKALANLDRMTEREKLRTRSIWHLMTGDYPKAIEECEALVRAFPADAAGASNLALAYFGARDMAKAIELGERRTALGERDINARYNLSWYFLGASQFEKAAERASAVVEANPQFTKAHVCLALSRLALGETAKAVASYEDAGALGDLGASMKAMGLADIAIFEGRSKDAATLLRDGAAADLGSKREAWAARKLAVLARVLWSSGREADALAAADKAVALSRAMEVLFPVAEVYLHGGQHTKALTLAGELANKIESDPRAYAKIIEAEALRLEGKFQGAIPLYGEARKIVDTWAGRFRLGLAYLDAGAFAAAHSEFETCLRRRGEAAAFFLDDWPSYGVFPEVYYYLGRSQEGLKSAGARESYAEFLKLRRLADPSVELTEDAKRRLARLGPG